MVFEKLGLELCHSVADHEKRDSAGSQEFGHQTRNMQRSYILRLGVVTARSMRHIDARKVWQE